MAESSRQKRITGRVMHEFKHGELKSGRGGKGGPVKSRRQAIAIALEEAGASKYESPKRNRRNLHRTEGKEAKGETAQQEREGRSHVGADRKRESTKAMKGRNAKKQTARGHRAAHARCVGLFVLPRIVLARLLGPARRRSRTAQWRTQRPWRSWHRQGR